MQNFKSEDISAISVYKDKATLASLEKKRKTELFILRQRNLTKRNTLIFLNQNLRIMRKFILKKMMTANLFIF